MHFCAQSLDQKNVEAQIGKGLLQSLEQYPKSIQVFRTIQKLNQMILAFYHTGNTYQKMGHLDDAIVALKKSVALT